MEIRHIPGRINPADTLTPQVWADDQEQADRVRASDQTMVQRLKVSSTATDEVIQKRLQELYSNRQEERETAQKKLIGQQRNEEE